jgi:hypothetical protein
MLINNVKLLQEDKPGRYILMANNFTEAAKSFSRIKGYELMGERFDALASLSTGCEKLLSGDAMGSLSYFENGQNKLSALKGKLLTDFNLGLFYNAVGMEETQGKILTDIAGFVTRGGGSDPMKTLDVIQRIMSFKFPTTGNWGYLLGNKDRFNEVFENLSNVLAAKNGGKLLITEGSGQYLVPFWDIDLKYSFETGTAWKKKGVEVTEDLLVQADFVIDPECLNNPASALTDIFSIRPEKSILSGITGKETSISGGEGIGRLSNTAAQNSPGARKIIVPLSTRREAEKAVTDYIAKCMGRESKLRLSKPYVKSLIYIPCDLNPGLSTPNGFGVLVPARARRTNVSQLIIV